MKTPSPLFLTTLVAAFLITGTFSFPLQPPSGLAVPTHKFLPVRAPAPAGVRPPKHRPDSDSDTDAPDPKRVDDHSSGSDSDSSSGAVPGRVWGQDPADPPTQQGPVQDPPSQHFGGTPGFIPIEQAGLPVQQPHPNPVISNIEGKGSRNIDDIQTAKSQNSAVNNHDYDRKFASSYFRKSEPAPGGPNVAPDIRNFLSQNGIDLNAPDVVKVRVFGRPYDPEAPGSPPQGKPNRDSDSEDSWERDSSVKDDTDTSIMEAYMSPSGGWMYRTRMFRSGEYDNWYDLPFEERLPISELMNRQWREVAGDAPLKKVVGANVEANDTVELLRDLRLTTGRTDGTIDPATDPQRFNQAVGSSQGNVVAFMVKDHHSEPIVGGGVPTSVAWRYTGGNARDGNGFETDYADSFLLVNIG